MLERTKRIVFRIVLFHLRGDEAGSRTFRPAPAPAKIYRLQPAPTNQLQVLRSDGGWRCEREIGRHVEKIKIDQTTNLRHFHFVEIIFSSLSVDREKILSLQLYSVYTSTVYTIHIVIKPI